MLVTADSSLQKTEFHWPTEHGAWGILLTPFACAAVLAGPSTRAQIIAVTLSAILILSAFLLRGSLEAQGGIRALNHPAHWLLGGLSAGSASLLILVFRRMELLGLFAFGAMLFGLQIWLNRKHQLQRVEKRSLPAELVGVALLTMTAPVAWIAVCGALDAEGVRVWLLNALFFTGSVLYVKYRVRGLQSHQDFGNWQARFAFVWPALAFHLLLVFFLFSLVQVNSLSASVLLAFAPALLRAMGLIPQLGQRFPIKRLGWTEIAHSVTFAVLLILTLR